MQHTPSTLINFHGREIVLTERGEIFDGTSFRRMSPQLTVAAAFTLAVGLAALLFGYGNAVTARVQYYAASAIDVIFSPPSKNTAFAVSYGSDLQRTPAPVLLPLSVSVPDPSEEPLPSISPQTPLVPRQIASAVIPEVRLTPAPSPSAQTFGELFIEKLGVRVPIMLPAVLDTKSVNKALESGTIIWPTAGRPGGDDPIILLGHSSSPLSYRGKYAKVFAMLGKLEPGDVITVTTPGHIFTYAVESRLTLDPKKDNEEQLFAEDGEALLLVSCWPVGTNWNRIVVRAERVE